MIVEPEVEVALTVELAPIEIVAPPRPKPVPLTLTPGLIERLLPVPLADSVSWLPAVTPAATDSAALE